MEASNNSTIKEAQLIYIDRLSNIGKSKQTVKAYRQGINRYLSVLEENGVDIHGSLDQLTIDTYDWMLASMAEKQDATRNLYITAVTGFLSYLIAMDLININHVNMQLLKASAMKKNPARLPQFSKDNINKVIIYAQSLDAMPAEDYEEKLRNYRDKALILTLADTGLRIHEACNLVRGSIDFDEGKAIITGKGNKDAVIRFTARSLRAIRDYIGLRSTLDGDLGKKLSSLPLFMRHDRHVGKKSKKYQLDNISTETGREIIKLRVLECLGPDAVGSITPHSFRHYFVTVVLNTTNNVRIAQELARHSNIATTTRYTHLTNQELDQAYYDSFEK
ncbi:MAG: tyrosine-type recombinase/integrase [Anaerolineaceae bacterium]|nr:tyrosine-type recombinase/integrase [Anaerolineaceae bacterium]